MPSIDTRTETEKLYAFLAGLPKSIRSSILTDFAAMEDEPELREAARGVLSAESHEEPTT